MAADTKIASLSTSMKSLQPAATWTKEVADRINMVSPIVGGEGIGVTQIPGVGTTVTNKRITNKRGDILAVVVTTGPNGEGDYSDNRYWFKEAYLHQADGGNVNSLARCETDPQTANTSAQTFTNLSEMAASTHTLTAGSLVWVTAIEGRIDSTATINQFTQYVTVPGATVAGHTVNTMTNFVAAGTVGTLTFQNLTVIAVNATSSSTITLPGGSTGSGFDWQGLLFAKCLVTADDTISATSPTSFATIMGSWPAVTNADGGTRYPGRVAGDTFRIRVGGNGVVAFTGSLSNSFVQFDAYFDGAGESFSDLQVTRLLFQDVFANAGSPNFDWALDIEATIIDSGTNGGVAWICTNAHATLSGPSLTLDGLSTRHESFAAANSYGAVEADDYVAGVHIEGACGATPLVGDLTAGTLILRSFSVEFLRPPLVSG